MENDYMITIDIDYSYEYKNLEDYIDSNREDFGTFFNVFVEVIKIDQQNSGVKKSEIAN